jgi:hypothetical protein
METWYHACGYPILVGWLGPQWREVRAYYDGDPDRPNRRITACPGCDGPLYFSNLVPAVNLDDVGDDGEEVD